MPHKVLEKVERRLGEKLLIKGERCAGPKCALLRRSYAPGMHGKGGKGGKRRRDSSEFGSLLREKQKVRYLYGLDDNSLKGYIKKAIAQKGTLGVNMVHLLEERLDNVVFRLGFAESRRQARQVVTHGHIAVNGRTINTPSYNIKKDDVISLKERAQKLGLAVGMDERLKSYEAPRWLQLDKVKKQGKVMAHPEPEDIQLLVDITKIKEYYAR